MGGMAPGISGHAARPALAPFTVARVVHSPRRGDRPGGEGGKPSKAQRIVYGAPWFFGWVLGMVVR